MYSQPGIVNVLDQGMYPGPLASPTNNATALQNAINEAATFGGIVLIPGDYLGETIYNLEPPGSGPMITVASSTPIMILGTGEGTVLNILQSCDFLSATASDNFVMQDLVIQYDQTEGPLTGTALTFTSCSYVKLFRVELQDCQYAVTVDNSFNANLTQCTISYTPAYGNANAIGVQLIGMGTSTSGSEEAVIDQCTFLSAASPDVSTDTTGLSLSEAHDLHCLSTSVIGFTTGISIVPSNMGSKDNYFQQVTVQSLGVSASVGAAVIIKANEQNLQNTIFVDCEFSPVPSDEAVYTNGGVYIDQAVDTVRFVSCTAIGWPGPGLQINGGKNIEVLGGVYSSNTQASGVLLGGISVTGPASNVRIVGASCAGSAYGAPSQQYGIYVGDEATNIFVRGCDLRNNLTSALPFNSSVSTCEVTNCAGYNDQANVRATSLPGTTSPAAVTNYDFEYYGPINFYIWGGGGVEVDIDGSPTHLSNGSFTLTPGHSASISYSSKPFFLLVGT